MSAMKSKLKKIRLVYALNAWIKARREKKIFFSTIQHYSKLDQKYSANELLNKKAHARLTHLKNLNRKIHFFYLGTDELQDQSGIIQALDQLGVTSFFTKSDMSYGQYTLTPIESRKSLNAQRLLEIFSELKLKNKVPDILIAQTFSTYIDVDVFSKLKELYGVLIINIGMDDRHQYWDNIHALIPHLDLALTAAPECVEWYLKEGCPALFFPEASDPDIFHPMPELAKSHEVSFVGAKYGIREKIVAALRKEGIKVTTFGSGWGNGYLPIKEVPKLFAQSKIVLGVGTIGHSNDFFALKMRDFDGPISGSCYVTHDNSDLHLLFEVGKELITYKTIDDCINKVRYLLNNNQEREQIAKAGYLRAKRDHTWFQRFSGLMNFLLEK